MSRRPIDLSGVVTRLREESNAILLLLLYLSGVAAGGAVCVCSEPFRSETSRVTAFLSGEQANLFTLLLAGSFLIVLCCSVLYGAGLCLIGSPCIYLTPFIVGFAGGAGMLAVLTGETPLPSVRCLLPLPCFALAVCCLLMLCDYASGMNTVLLKERGGREAGEEKKYAARFLILSGVILVCGCTQILLTALLRHLQ